MRSPLLTTVPFFFTLTSATQLDSHKSQKLKAKKYPGQDDVVSFLRPVSSSQKLRICNAYGNAPDNAADLVQVFDGRGKPLEFSGSREGLKFKECGDINLHLQPGDKLVFKQPSAIESIGAFEISDLPAAAATLFLAFYRRYSDSDAVSFVSHTFNNDPSENSDSNSYLKGTQVAVLDCGVELSEGNNRVNNFIDIADRGNSDTFVSAARGGRPVGRRERVDYNTVVSINAGRFEAQLYEGNQNSSKNSGKEVNLKEESSSTLRGKTDFAAIEGENYVIMRVSGLGKEGTQDDVVVFPQTSEVTYFSRAAEKGIAGSMWTGIKTALGLAK